MLLTRLPVGRFAGAPDLGRCVWAFPLVGLVVGGIGSLVYGLAHWLGMPPLVAAEAGCIVGRDYPAPIVDHAVARARALAVYGSVLAKRR